MMKITIEDHVLVYGERNPLQEEATIRVEFAGKVYTQKLEAVSLRNMNMADSHLTAQWESGDQHILCDEEIHEAGLTWDQEHPPEKEEGHE